MIVRSSTAHLRHDPNNALLFSYLRNALRRPGISEVSIGLESVQEEMGSLDHFKAGMGFRQAAVGQRIDVSPRLRPILKGPVLKAIRGAARMLSGRERFGKLAGMLKWYEEQPRLR